MIPFCSKNREWGNNSGSNKYLLVSIIPVLGSLLMLLKFLTSITTWYVQPTMATMDIQCRSPVSVSLDRIDRAKKWSPKERRGNERSLAQRCPYAAHDKYIYFAPLSSAAPTLQHGLQWTRITYNTNISG